MFRFDLPQALWLLALIPVALGVRGWLGRRRRASVRFSSLHAVAPLGGGARRLFRWLPITLRAAALASLVIALARPQFGIGQVRTSTNGVAMMLVVDRSASMIETMMLRGRQITRIDAVKDVVKRFVLGDGKELTGRPGDMIGLVTFARFADTVCPLVRIHDTLVQLVERIELVGATREDPEAGTAIGEGLALGAARLRDVERELSRRAAQSGGKKVAGQVEADPTFTIKSKVIVLLTDGVENTGEVRAMQAAELCRRWGIKVYAIGIGAGGGGPRSQVMPGGFTITRGTMGFDDSTLKQIARLTGGRYYPANDAESLAKVYKEIDVLEKTEIKSEEFTSYDEKFVPFALAAAVMLALEALLSATWLRRAP